MGPAIIWDFVGKLVDNYPAITLAYAVALATFSAEARFERIVELSSHSLDRCTRQLAADYGLAVADLEMPFRRAYSQITSADQPPFPGERVLRPVMRVCEHQKLPNVQQINTTLPEALPQRAALQAGGRV